jgi:hypothetical protein
MKNAFCPATTFHGSGALPFVIPKAKPRDLQFRGPFLEMPFRQSVAQGTYFLNKSLAAINPAPALPWGVP